MNSFLLCRYTPNLNTIPGNFQYACFVKYLGNPTLLTYIIKHYPHWISVFDVLEQAENDEVYLLALEFLQTQLKPDQIGREMLKRLSRHARDHQIEGEAKLVIDKIVGEWKDQVRLE
jgi:hypothetical protein